MAGTVDGACAIACYGVEPAFLAEDLLTDDGNHGGEENSERADLAQRALHGLRHTEADTVRRLGDVLAQPCRKLAGLDVLEGDGALLRAGNTLFGDEKNVVRLGQHGRAVLFRDVKDIVLVRDQMRADRQALIADAVHNDNVIFTNIRLEFFHDSPSISSDSVFFYSKATVPAFQDNAAQAGTGRCRDSRCLRSARGRPV